MYERYFIYSTCYKRKRKANSKRDEFCHSKNLFSCFDVDSKNAPYNDQIFDDGVIEYEGHDVPANINPEKKLVDQSLLSPSGTPTENGKFFQAALDYKHGLR